MSFSKIALLFCILSLILSGCAKEKRIKNLGSLGKNVICFGNSLTLGEGATSGNDYPSFLAKNIEAPVINAGEAGDSTEDALKRITQDVLNQDPRIVIVEFGGNDFLRGIPQEKTLENLDKMIEQIQDKGAMAVLLEVKTALMQDSYLAGYKRIAQKRGAYLIPDILKGIMTEPNLKSDYIHPNDAGYQIMAKRILKVIKRILN